MQESIQARFQKQLKSKLQFKASSKVSPDTFLYKSFKFFDLFNNGYVDKGNFFKTMAKCGVVVDTHNVENIYRHYANREDGNVDYKVFIEELLFKEDEQAEQRQYSEMSQSQYSTRQQQLHLQPQPQSPQSPMQGSPLSQSHRSHQALNQSRIAKLYTQCQTYSQVIDYIKKHLRQKSLSSLLNFAVELKSTDTTRTHKINKQKLRSKLTYLSEKAIDLIMIQFTNTPHGEINYAELIYSLKGQLQPQHQLIIERAFNLLDSNHEKEIQIDKVINQFKHHQYKDQFINTINLYQHFQGIDDGVFTDQDFIDFFGFVAFAFSDAQQFTNFIEKAYFFDDDTRSQRSHGSVRSREFKPDISSRQNNNIIDNVNNNNMKDIMQPDFRKNKQEINRDIYEKQKRQQTANREQIIDDKRSVSRHSQSQIDKKSTTTSFYIKQVEMIVLRIKKRLASRGTRGFLVFQKSMKNADTDQDGLITLDQFKQVIKDLKIDITNSQTNLVFDVFDPDSTNLISYDQLIHTFKGTIPDKRNQLFDRVWATVSLSEELTTFSQIKHVLNFRGHPDIQTGRRYDDQIWKQIQQTILLIQELNGTPRSQNITKKQFYEYFQNLSLTTSEDLLFQSLLQNFWKIQPKVNINEMYAGSRKLFDPTSKGYLMDHHRYAVKGGSISSNAPFGTSNEPTNYFTEHSKL